MQLSTTKRNTAPEHAHGIEFRCSDGLDDPSWDRFLAETPGGHHVQTSLWARLKATAGWSVGRVVAWRDDRIVGGAQMLIKRLPVGGALAYVQKGPTLLETSSSVSRGVVDRLHGLARDERVRLLGVMPPDNAHALERDLLECDFEPSPYKAWLGATTVVDLQQDLDEILANMRAKTRYNVRVAMRGDIQVRLGGEDDIPRFHELLASTAKRQGFRPNSAAYLQQMWRLFAPRGHCQLVLAEHGNELVSAALLIAFGDTVLYKRGAWSGTHGRQRPNEAMHWWAIQWAKQHGYRYYDFEGISPDVARAILQGRDIPPSAEKSVARFKIGFGGQIRLLPETYLCAYNPLLRHAVRNVVPTLEGAAKLVRGRREH